MAIIGTQNNFLCVVNNGDDSKENSTDHSGISKILEFLDYEVHKRASQYNDPKNILLPVKGAREAQVPLPFKDVKDFNARYGTGINQTAWSRWINGSGNYIYGEDELNPYIFIFKQMKGNM